MCVIALAYKTPRLGPLVLVANRDELHARASAPLAWWGDAPDVLGGRDLEGGGSWLAISRHGRFAAVTNVREGQRHVGRRSRGELVRRFVEGRDDAQAFARQLAAERADYAPFDLLLVEIGDLYHFHSVRGTLARLTPGVHTLSNATLDTPWPKCRLLAGHLSAAVRPPAAAEAFEWLSDRSVPPVAELPNTGVGLAREKLLAPVLIAGYDYGTRASTLLTVGAGGRVALSELARTPGGGRGQLREFRLNLEPIPRTSSV